MIDMAVRNLLHKHRLQEFLQWCRTEKNLQVRDGRGDYQLAQIQPRGSKTWHVIYGRHHMPEHVTVPDPLVPLVRNFVSSTSAILDRGTVAEFSSAPGA